MLPDSGWFFLSVVIASLRRNRDEMNLNFIENTLNVFLMRYEYYFISPLFRIKMGPDARAIQ